MRKQSFDEVYEPYESFETYEEDAPLPHAGFRVASRVMDFVGVMVSTLLILALMALGTALIGWLRGDLNATFSGIGQNINEAVVIDAQQGQQHQPTP